jgi:hypothetical protein
MLRPSVCIGGAMRKLVVVGSSIAIVLIVGWIAYQAFLKKKSHPAKFGSGAALVCPSLPNQCPDPKDLDQNGCPNFDAAKGECSVSVDYYKEYGGCTDDHQGMAFYVNPKAGQASKFHIVTLDAKHPIAVEFTQIDCTTHDPKGVVGAGQPFLPSRDDFSAFLFSHTSGAANPQAYDQCFKVIVQPRDADCIDPHIIIKGD